MDTMRSSPIPPTATIFNSRMKYIIRSKEMLHTDFPPRCYYCNSKPDSITDYEIHVVMKTAYPRPANIRKHMLKKQGMLWENDA